MTALRAAESNNDILCESGDFVVSSAKECYATILKAAVLTVLGELQLDTNRGIPYFDTIFTKPAKVEMWYNRMQRTITSFPFVRSILEFNYRVDYSAKIVHYDMTVMTEDGEVSVSSETGNP